MGKTCVVTGKKTSMGNQIVRRGKAKYLGGVGRKVTGISRRKFKPNLQKVKVESDGEVKRLWVSTKALRSGLVKKPTKRKAFSLPKV
ncbi:MAG TPA: 50S ribosomal protein L28 [Gemmatales bacterium]|nr:50S ribosomal protein L28 [Gemmatales bacterium]